MPTPEGALKTIVVFADTAGFHCGGYVKKGKRIMSTLTYAANTHLWNKEFRFTEKFKKEFKSKLGIYGRYAVTGKV